MISSFTLALFAAVASANGSSPAPTQNGFYAGSGSSHHYSGGQYGHENGHSNRGFSGNHYYGHSAYAPKQQSHGHEHHYPTTTDPAKASWFSPYTQYSPAKIAFKPTTEYPCFAICEMPVGGITGSIQLAQLPNKPPVAQGMLGGLANEVTIKITIHETGKLLASDGGEMCDQVGAEFNPLNEINHSGQVNPYQDPRRGRFLDIVSSDTGIAIVDKNRYLLQNLTGKDGILGRSLLLTQVNSDDSTTVIACCAIVQDELPSAYKPKAYPYYHGTHQHETHVHQTPAPTPATSGHYGHSSHGGHGSHGVQLPPISRNTVFQNRFGRTH